MNRDPSVTFQSTFGKCRSEVTNIGWWRFANLTEFLLSSLQWKVTIWGIHLEQANQAVFRDKIYRYICCWEDIKVMERTTNYLGTKVSSMKLERTWLWRRYYKMKNKVTKKTNFTLGCGGNWRKEHFSLHSRLRQIFQCFLITLGRQSPSFLF